LLELAANIKRLIEEARIYGVLLGSQTPHSVPHRGFFDYTFDEVRIGKLEGVA
jgi:hypothetical protein